MISMRNALVPLMIILMMVSCNSPEKNKKARTGKGIPTYTIGINLPLSGNGSYYSEEFKKGLDLSFDFMAQSKDKININVIYEDNKLNPKDAVSITKKFIEIDKVDIIMAGYTPIIKATSGMAASSEVPMLATISSLDQITGANEWVFRDFATEMQLMPLLASFAYSGLELTKGSYLVVNDDMGNDAARFFKEKFNELGGEFEDGERFEPGDLDLRNKISKLMDEGPEFILVIGRGASMINACRQIRERDDNIPILGNNTLDNETVWDALGESGNNFWFPRPKLDFNSKRFVRANERYIEIYGQDMNWLNIYGFSIANYLARGLKESGGDKYLLKNYLKTLNVQSIRGKLVMNDAGDVDMPHIICERKNGQSIIIDFP